jgi:hypothetical protein
MDFDEERDFADQGPLTDIDMEEDSQILATLLKHLPSCINAADIEQMAAYKTGSVDRRKLWTGARHTPQKRR